MAVYFVVIKRGRVWLVMRERKRNGIYDPLFDADVHDVIVFLHDVFVFMLVDVL